MPEDWWVLDMMCFMGSRRTLRERMWIQAILRVTCEAGLRGQVTLIFHLIPEFFHLKLLTVGWVNLCCCFFLFCFAGRGVSYAPWEFSSTSCLSTLDARSTHLPPKSWKTKNVCGHCQISFRGKVIPGWESLFYNRDIFSVFFFFFFQEKIFLIAK